MSVRPLNTRVLVGLDDGLEEDDRSEGSEGSEDDEAAPRTGARAFARTAGRATALAANALFDTCPRFATPPLHEIRVMQ